MQKALIVLLALLMLPPAWAESRQFFRYQDENGRTVIRSSIPPSAAKRGYEIVDADGMVLEVVEPQASEEEIRQRRQAEQQAQFQRARDEELLKLYRSPADVDRAMRTWLSRLDMEIRLKRNRIDITEAEYDQLQSRAADQERAGETVSQDLVERMAALEQRIATFEAEIAEVEERKADARTRFMAERERMVELYERVNGRPWEEARAEE